MKATFTASSDVALVKYWGKKDEVLRLPENGSISMILNGLDTTTTVEFDAAHKHDSLEIRTLTQQDAYSANQASELELQRVSKHLDRVRKRAGITTPAKVVSQNSFPKGTGLSSSGSGFAALTLAAAAAAGLELTEKELSILARQGSGTACRCVCGGFVEWHDGDTSETSFSSSLHDADYWDIRDVVAVVDEGMKKISSTEGHKQAQSGPFFLARQHAVHKKLSAVKTALQQKNFQQLGELVEAEALEFHSILFTSQPPMIAWYPGTVQVMHEVQALRSEGVACYFTINTGFNVHVLTLPEFEKVVAERLAGLSLVTKTLTARVGDKPQQLKTHLF